MKTQILGPHEALPYASEKGQINGPKPNKVKDRYGKKWKETDRKLQKKTQKNRNRHKPTKNYMEMVNFLI